MLWDLIRDRIIIVESLREGRVELWTTKERSSSRHILIHYYISHCASSPAVFHYSYLNESDSWTVTSVCHLLFQPPCFSLFFFLYHSCESEQERWSHKGFNHLGFLQWRRDLHIGHWFFFVVDSIVRGGRWLVSCLSDCVGKKWKFFDCETEGV